MFYTENNFLRDSTKAMKMIMANIAVGITVYKYIFEF